MLIRKEAIEKSIMIFCNEDITPLTVTGAKTKKLLKGEGSNSATYRY
jgi:hypothetical protein